MTGPQYAGLGRLACVGIVTVSGLILALSATTNWALKRGWPHLPAKFEAALSDRVIQACFAGPAVSLSLWLLLLAASRRSHPEGAATAGQRLAWPFALGMLAPLLLLDRWLWAVGIPLLGLLFVDLRLGALSGSRPAIANDLQKVQL